MKEYKSFYKEVDGDEGVRCYYPTRLDTYGCGCQHDCSYCYAKSLLTFRGLWDTQEPSVADIEKIRRKAKKISKMTNRPVIRMGGMTDCFQALEREHNVTYETIKEFNKYGIEYLIVTKSDMVAEDRFIDVMDKELAHIQITVTCTDDDLYKRMAYEKAPLPSRRIKAIEKLQEEGFDVQLRLSPFIPEFVNLDTLNAVKCDKILVEFLRVNWWIKQWFKIDYSDYTIKQSGYLHLPLAKKIELLKGITGFKSVSVCEDENEAYIYWAEHFNPQRDCCNLRRKNND